MIHYNTENISFIKLSIILEEMGIKNNTFFLELYDEDLINIDPFSENLTTLEKAKITQEIIKNPWYFLREIVRIPTSGILRRYELHRGNLALTWCMLNDISSFIVWPRQKYKTTSCSAVYLWMFYWGTVHNRSCFLAHEDAAVKKNLQGVKDIRDNLPTWLNLYNSKNDRDNEKEMVNKSLDNRITCRAPARSSDSAVKAGRGLTTPIQWFDEVAFIPYIYDMYDAISFAYSTASKIAKENGTPYHQNMSTTAGFLNSEEGKWAYKFLNSCADFTELFYDMDIEVVKNIIDNSSTSGFVLNTYMYYDLGSDDNYLEEQKKRVINSLNPQDTLDREVLNIWKAVGTNKALSQDRIERLLSLIRKPNDYIIINNTYSMRVYVDIDEFDWSKPLIGGMDLGGNLKGDFSTLVITDPETFSVIAVLRTNSQSTTLFSMAIISIMSDLCPNMVLFPERNYNGAIIDTIVTYVMNSRRRVYHENDDEDRPGLFNSKKIRPILFNDILKIVVDDHGHKIYDKNIIGEMSELIRKRDGRIDHPLGKHDDTLISYLLSIYFLLYVKDNYLYIDKNIILSDSKRSGNLKIENKNKGVSLKMKNIIGKSYLSLMNHNPSNINSMDDIANLMHDDFKKDNKINTSIESINGNVDEKNIEELEENDNLSEVRSGLQKIQKEKSTTEVFVDNNSSINQKNDFDGVFKDYFNRNDNVDLFGQRFGW